MKYIRTKDGNIYELSYISSIFNDKDLEIYNCISKTPNAIICVERKNVIKQADTIEELCDEFVCEEHHTLLLPYYKKKNEEGNANETYHQGIMNAIKEKKFNYIHYHWFGAIWTDKGLIYVAKMNEKGELELL